MENTKQLVKQQPGFNKNRGNTDALTAFILAMVAVCCVLPICSLGILSNNLLFVYVDVLMSVAVIVMCGIALGLARTNNIGELDKPYSAFLVVARVFAIIGLVLGIISICWIAFLVLTMIISGFLVGLWYAFIAFLEVLTSTASAA